ncbi:MAG: Gfo/Idh/MocA family oxidoreductase [Isosphaeraceae bacterium]
MRHPQEVPHKPSRRAFLTGAAQTAAVGFAFPTVIPASALGLGGKVAPSNRIALGVIGTGNQGFNDLRSFLKDERVQIVAVCDVNRESPGYWDGKLGGREPARRLVEEHYAGDRPSGTYRGCQALVDFREVLGRQDIDAVEVCTPDHWHAIPVIEACKAKKDIYCQKPLSLTIAEGRAMSYAVSKHGVVFQTGSQQRSDPLFRHACELVRNGRIGTLKTARVGLPEGRKDYAKTGDQKDPKPVPDGFDYDRWLGPAPDAPYAPARCHVNFRWIYDYSGGQVTDWGGHHPDCAQWGMGTEMTGPVEIRNAKGAFPTDKLWNTATEYSFEAVYENGLTMVISSTEKMGVTFVGTEGTIHVDRGKLETDPVSLKDTKIASGEVHLYRSDDHFRNFIDCVISRGPTAAPVEVAHRSITICHLGNIAMRLGRERLRWDPRTERILGDAEASAMLNRPYRHPWTLSEV